MSFTPSSRISRRRARSKRIAEMNITNLVDVIMTILICYIIVTPMLKHGIQIDVPHAESQPVEAAKRHMVKITKEEHLYLDEIRMDMQGLEAALVKVAEGEEDPLVYLEADKTLPYGKVMEVMSSIKKAKIAKVGLITTIKR